MNRKVHHGIIYSNYEPLHRKSCIIFNNRICLAPASLLLNSFEQIRDETRSMTNFDIEKELKVNRMIDTSADRRCHNLTKYHFKVIYEHSEVLFESDAIIVNLFKSRNIWNSFNDILRNFVVRSSRNNKNDLSKLLLSSFVVLRLKKVTESDPGTSSADIFNYIIENTLLTGLNQPIDTSQLNCTQKLENIQSISTPFGNECFLNTINSGRIANIFGDNNCMMVLGFALVSGCEGGGIYNKSQEIIGIVISTTFDWNNENATLTLVAKFDEIMAEFVDQSKLKINIKSEYERCSSTKCNCGSGVNDKDTLRFENFIVLIQSSANWGSGCFLKINEMKVIITCAHVLENHDGMVRCNWKFGYFESKIIYKNPHFDEAFDIAILEAPQSVPEQYFTKCYATPTRIGQTVYTSGFPHFDSLGKVHSFFPSIFEGRITKISKGVIFSDASVQSGQSGGPMFTDDGRLIGITVSNSKDDNYQLIYPNVNMSVPVIDILPILQKYDVSRGKNISKSSNNHMLQKIFREPLRIISFSYK